MGIRCRVSSVETVDLSKRFFSVCQREVRTADDFPRDLGLIALSTRERYFVSENRLSRKSPVVWVSWKMASRFPYKELAARRRGSDSSKYFLTLIFLTSIFGSGLKSFGSDSS